jgi:hypothetical protein
MPIGRGQRGKQQVRTGRVARLRNGRLRHHPPADARWRRHRLLIPAAPALQLRPCSLKIAPLAAHHQHSALPPGHSPRALGAVTVLMPEPRGIPQRACVLEQTASGRFKPRGVLVRKPRRILQPGRILVASASLLGRCRQHRRQPVLDALRNTQGASPERGPACGCSGSVLLALRGTVLGLSRQLPRVSGLANRRSLRARVVPDLAGEHDTGKTCARHVQGHARAQQQRADRQGR